MAQCILGGQNSVGSSDATTIKETLLWTNPSPTEDFVSTADNGNHIDFDFEKYNFFKLVFKTRKDLATEHVVYGQVSSTDGRNFAFGTSSGARNIYKYGTNQLCITDCYYTSNSYHGYTNQDAIPLSLYGVVLG